MTDNLHSCTGHRLKARKIISCVLWTCSAAMLIKAVFPMFQISGESMSPTLEDGEFIITRRCRKVKKGDVVIFRHGGNLLIKRVAASECERVEITADSRMKINGEIISEPYAHGEMGSIRVTVPPKSYFLMGDNRKVSVDSRSEKVGCVHENMIFSKAVLRIYPFSKASIIK